MGGSEGARERKRGRERGGGGGGGEGRGGGGGGEKCFGEPSGGFWQGGLF
eukprot:COSAG03_NODE_1320_length_4331_cov_3.789934_4_plen_49_part_01